MKVGHEYKASTEHGIWVISSLFKTFWARVIPSISDHCQVRVTNRMNLGWTIIIQVRSTYSVCTYVKKGGSQEQAKPPPQANRPLFHWTPSTCIISRSESSNGWLRGSLSRDNHTIQTGPVRRMTLWMHSSGGIGRALRAELCQEKKSSAIPPRLLGALSNNAPVCLIYDVSGTDIRTVLIKLYPYF